MFVCLRVPNPWIFAQERHHLDLRVAKTHVVPVISGLFKIILSYCQCLGAISRFYNIRWPVLFTEFMELLQELLPEVMTVLPAECIAGDRLGFPFELITTMLLPIGLISTIGMVVIFMRLASPLGRASSPGVFADEHGLDPLYARRRELSQREIASGSPDDNELVPYVHYGCFRTALASLWYAASSPSVINVLIFMMLWIYPMICRKTLAIFDCVAAGNDADGNPIALLRDDPVVLCFVGDWTWLAVLSGAAIVIYDLGVPYLAFVMARGHRRDVLAKQAEERDRLNLRAVARVKRKKVFKGSAFVARLVR